MKEEERRLVTNIQSDLSSMIQLHHHNDPVLPEPDPYKNGLLHYLDQGVAVFHSLPRLLPTAQVSGNRVRG